MKNKLITCLRASCSGLFIKTYEEGRAEAEARGAVLSLRNIEGFGDYQLYDWSITQGITRIPLVEGEKAETLPDTGDPFAMLAAFMGKLPNKSVLLVRDLHGPLVLAAQGDPSLLRKLKDALLDGQSTHKALLFVGCQLTLPPEVEREIMVLEFALPTREELRAVLSAFLETNALDEPDNVDGILDAARGLTLTEAEKAFAISFIECGSIRADVVAREKAQTVKKNGLLEIVENKVTLADVGGLENFKRELYEMRNLFTQAARDFGLDSPRGQLAVGQGGSGKSLLAQATRDVFKLPLIRLAADRLFDSLVGGSERNWRIAFATAQAVAPCILWIDEVDGLFSGMGGPSTDGGTTQRVLKTILTDMQMNSEGIFFFFTANDVDRLPDPLIDRLDVWSVDLPHQGEREAIWKIHIAKRGRNPADFPIADLAALTDGYSGRQIEQLWLQAIRKGFNAGRQPVLDDVRDVLKQMKPTSELMKDAIEARRRRLANRARPASAEPVAATAKGRKLVA